MARKTKDIEKEIKLKEKNAENVQVSAVFEDKKKTSTNKKKSSVKSNNTKTKKSTSTAKKRTAKKKSSTKTNTKKTSKKNSSKKENSKISTQKKRKNIDNKKSFSKVIIKNAPKSMKTNKYRTAKKIKYLKFETEYYDLPFSYNKTVVKILAQTPTTLFVYWELAEKDADNFRKIYGDNFFDVTKPILVLYNDTMNYVHEIEINDFANSWYINVNDSNCDYHVELGRKPISTPHNRNNNFVNNANFNNGNTDTYIDLNSKYIPYYVYITSSNEMILPNDKILFTSDENSKIIFRNIKTGSIKERNIKEFKFITNYGIFTIQELYKYLYPNENFEYDEFLRNPSSGLRSSMSSR